MSSPSRPVRLSKSRIMRGIQCEKSLYLTLHQPELAAEADSAQQAIFNQGHLVGLEAQKRFPNGVLIDASHFDSQKALEQTQAALDAGANTIFEATFMHEDVLVKVDILHRKNAHSYWSIIEVKSSTSVKEEHIQDASIQAWVLQGCGMKIGDIFIWHINSECTYPNLDDLFTKARVTFEVQNATASVVARILNLKTLLGKAKSPDLDIGPHCDSPYECPFKTHCWGAKKVPDLSVFDIPGLHAKRKWEFYQKEKVTLEQLQSERLNPGQMKMVEVSVLGTRSIDRETIREELKSWQYPLYFLDFESIAPAIPRYPGTHAYQQIPFQFSCHAQLKKGGPLIHNEYLHHSETDPRPELIRAMLDSLGKLGSVVAYNKAFEGRCLDDLAEAFPKHAKALQAIRKRLVDPLPLIRKSVYDKAFYGSFSIKSVAPALLGESLSYEGMPVSNGSEAQSAFEELIHPTTSSGRKTILRMAMLDYCRKDTLAMVLLAEWLAAHSAEKA